MPEALSSPEPLPDVKPSVASKSASSELRRPVDTATSNSAHLPLVLSSFTRPARPPTILDPSRLTININADSPQVLGYGTFGVVYPAMLDAVCPVAVKHLRPRPLHSTTTPVSRESAREYASRHARLAKRQFRREIRRYTALRTVPGVVRFYGLVGKDMFVVERLFGGALSDVLRHSQQNALLSPRCVLRLAGMLANAIADIHRRGISHSDLKPSNVLISEPLSRVGSMVTDTMHVKLVDFGLSRRFQPADDEDDYEEDDDNGDDDDDCDGENDDGNFEYARPSDASLPAKVTQSVQLVARRFSCPISGTEGCSDSDAEASDNESHAKHGRKRQSSTRQSHEDGQRGTDRSDRSGRAVAESENANEEDANDTLIRHQLAAIPLDARGTPAYLAPEGWCGPSALSRRRIALKADVYALGMILYELETGMVPWQAMSEWGIFVAVCNQVQRPAWPAGTGRVTGLRAVVEQCWAQNYKQRPTCRQVARLIQEQLDEMDVAAATGTDKNEKAISNMMLGSESESETAHGANSLLGDSWDDLGRQEQRKMELAQSGRLSRVSSDDVMLIDTPMTRARQTRLGQGEGQGKGQGEGQGQGHGQGEGQGQGQGQTHERAHQGAHQGAHQEQRSGMARAPLHEQAFIGRGTGSGTGTGKSANHIIIGRNANIEGSQLAGQQIKPSLGQTMGSAHTPVTTISALSGNPTPPPTTAPATSAVTPSAFAPFRPLPRLHHQHPVSPTSTRPLPFLPSPSPTHNLAMHPSTLPRDKLRLHTRPPRQIPLPLPMSPQKSLDPTSNGYEPNSHDNAIISSATIASHTHDSTELIHPQHSHHQTPSNSERPLPAAKSPVNKFLASPAPIFVNDATNSVHANDTAVSNDSSLSPTQNSTAVAMRSLEYPYKDQVLRDDCAALCSALSQHEHNPRESTQVLEALGVMLDDSQPNCTLVANGGSLLLLATILSRFGRNDFRLCKSVCVVILRLAVSQNSTVEMKLRITGACDMVLNCMRWHPADLPVIQNGACTLNALCHFSTALCSVFVSQGGPSTALRAIARAATTFDRDVPVASVGLEVLTATAKNHAHALLSNGILAGVFSHCDAFEHCRIDERFIDMLYMLLLQLPDARDKIICTRDCMGVLSRLVDRTRGSANWVELLKQTCEIVSELAMSSMRVEAAEAFLSSNVVESVMESLRLIGTSQGVADASVAAAGLQCLRNMSGLGRDVCGSLQMSNVFELCRELVAWEANSRAIASNVALLVLIVFKQVKSTSTVTNMDAMWDMLSEMRDKWRHDTKILENVGEAMGLIREVSPSTTESKGKTKTRRMLSSGHSGGSPRSGRKMFMRKKAP